MHIIARMLGKVTNQSNKECIGHMSWQSGPRHHSKVDEFFFQFGSHVCCSSCIDDVEQKNREENYLEKRCHGIDRRIEKVDEEIVRQIFDQQSRTVRCLEVSRGRR